MLILPDSVLDIIYANLHQLCMRRTLELIQSIGPSDIEDLPDLIFDGPVFMTAMRADDAPGWSERVSECRVKRMALSVDRL